ncbi:hypothetical protein SLEP1_g48729 [Rubroshorea leprosula]|uniref:Uncharacterized protein n=1 Tax=Rubroshorea leprosula TaxID=152421 RepID=A0AAV5LUQ9_9ROSI|nr:hypothetical protein SLEP1_g48729 [Rubroshorea leprosula]
MPFAPRSPAIIPPGHRQSCPCMPPTPPSLLHRAPALATYAPVAATALCAPIPRLCLMHATAMPLPHLQYFHC